VGNLGPWEILIIAGVIILLFGARKMPEMARSLGRSARILKAETKGMREDEKDAPAAVEAASTATTPKTDDEVAKLRAQLADAEDRAKAAERQAQVPQVAPPIEQTQANKNAG
jgi:sec-independent protein translocase protein TatA